MKEEETGGQREEGDCSTGFTEPHTAGANAVGSGAHRAGPCPAEMTRF
jgi:hypothetical protein